MEFLLDQLAGAGPVSGRRMFGEYCLYYAGRPVGLVCDEQLYLKPTEAGRRLQALKEPQEGAPFPGARPHLRVTADHWDDSHWLCQLVRATAEELPPPKMPRPRSSAAKAGAPATPALDALPNLGPKSLQMLATAGIRDLPTLRKLGSVAAYVRVRAGHPRASLNLLWALEGALSGQAWQEVASQHRTSLLLALEQALQQSQAGAATRAGPRTSSSTSTRRSSRKSPRG